MNIFQKIKSGANKAADKAQQAVEIARLNNQISAKKKEMEHHLLQLGRIVYDFYSQNNLPGAEKEIARISDMNRLLEQDIRKLRSQVDRLKQEKTCECGMTVARDTRYCPNCGHCLIDPEEPQSQEERHTDDEEWIAHFTEPVEEEVEVEIIEPRPYSIQWVSGEKPSTPPEASEPAKQPDATVDEEDNGSDGTRTHRANTWHDKDSI